MSYNARQICILWVRHCNSIHYAWFPYMYDLWTHRGSTQTSSIHATVQYETCIKLVLVQRDDPCTDTVFERWSSLANLPYIWCHWWTPRCNVNGPVEYGLVAPLAAATDLNVAGLPQSLCWAQIGYNPWIRVLSMRLRACNTRDHGLS